VVPFAVVHATYEPPNELDVTLPNAGGNEPIGVAGLVLFAFGILLAAILGNKALAAAMACGLVLYGGSVPIADLFGAIKSPTVALLFALASVGLGIAALATLWRTWIAAGSGLGARDPDRAQLPVVIGAIALIIQVGLKYGSSLANNDLFVGDDKQGAPALLAAAAGIALILAAALVLGMSLTKDARTTQPAPEPVAR
jgi:hypothetical protein